MMCVVEWCSHDLGESASHDSSVYLFYKVACSRTQQCGGHACIHGCLHLKAAIPRYPPQIADSAKKFGLLQFGLSAFSPSPLAIGWVARTFNFYLFPAVADGQCRRFLCEVGAASTASRTSRIFWFS